MTKIMTARAGSDGVLNLTVPLGQAGSNKTVRVTVETVEDGSSAATPNRAAWLAFLERTGGSITDPSFARHPQGDYEDREPLP